MISLGEDQLQSDGAANLLALRNILVQGAKKGLYRCLAVASDVRVRMHDTGEVVDACAR